MCGASNKQEAQDPAPSVVRHLQQRLGPFPGMPLLHAQLCVAMPKGCLLLLACRRHSGSLPPAQPRLRPPPAGHLQLGEGEGQLLAWLPWASLPRGVLQHAAATGHPGCRASPLPLTSLSCCPLARCAQRPLQRKAVPSHAFGSSPALRAA
jgi:hypothetical protein